MTLAALTLVLTHMGRLLGPDDKPAAGQVALTFALHSNPAPGGADATVWTDTFAGVGLDATGVYVVELGEPQDAQGGAHAAFPADAFAADRWLSVAVNGEVLSPWLRVG